MTNATACIRWLAGMNPDLGEARAAASRIATEGKRASDVIDRIRTLVKKGRARVGAVDAAGCMVLDARLVGRKPEGTG